MIGRDEEDGEGMGEPRWAGVPRLPGAANLHPAQVSPQLVHMCLERASSDAISSDLQAVVAFADVPVMKLTPDLGGFPEFAGG